MIVVVAASATAVVAEEDEAQQWWEAHCQWQGLPSSCMSLYGLVAASGSGRSDTAMQLWCAFAKTLTLFPSIICTLPAAATPQHMMISHKHPHTHTHTPGPFFFWFLSRNSVNPKPYTPLRAFLELDNIDQQKTCKPTNKASVVVDLKLEVHSPLWSRDRPVQETFFCW